MLFSRYQISSETQTIGSDFIFDCVNLHYYKFHRISFKPGGTCIDSTDWMKKKKATINTRNDDDNCFQYPSIIALNHEKIVSYPEIVSNIKSLINSYNWQGINYPLKIEDWKRFEKSNLTIALNVLYITENEICPAFVSKINSNCEKEISLLVIPNEEKKRKKLKKKLHKKVL